MSRAVDMAIIRARKIVIDPELYDVTKEIHKPWPVTVVRNFTLNIVRKHIRRIE